MTDSAEFRQRVKMIFEEALELPPIGRRAFVRERCAGDSDVENAVESLLAGEETASRSLRPTATFEVASVEEITHDRAELTIELAGAAGLPDLDRFLLTRRIGKGSFGTVFEAFDRERNEAVAIKVLNESTPERLARFRDEFRATAELKHPNLLRLGEFYSDNRLSYFTMELVRGRSFLEYVRHEYPATGPCDVHRLASAFPQLCRGVHALHRANILHRDLKPENVLVNDSGRVVILDFGLVLDLSPYAGNRSIAGTPRYMAPEQRYGQPGRPADWFSVGVMLYQAMTGTFPWDRLQVDAPRPISSTEPESTVEIAALDSLCMELLSLDPARRPSGDKILLQLESIFGDVHVNLDEVEVKERVFVGRRQQMKCLMSLLESSLAGQASVGTVYGRSGLGKTTLLRRFLLQVRETYPRAVILSGNCHLNETVPFKALDGVMVMLSRYLRGFSAQELDIILPRDIGFAGRLFPVLLQVETIARLAPEEAVADSVEFRRRAFQSIIQLLGRLARPRIPVVISIDDLQWGDLDSAALLKEMLQTPLPPPVLLISSYRLEDSESSEILQILRGQLKDVPPAMCVTEIALEELSQDEAIDLARHTIRSCSEEERKRIAAESAGDPFLIDQYARHRARVGESGAINLRELIGGRISALASEARELLYVVAVAGRPVTYSVLKIATGIAGYVATLESLCSEELLRMSVRDGQREVSCFHDKIREYAAALLSEEERRNIHQRLADIVAVDPAADLAVLSMHLAGAGRNVEAAERAIEAGEKAFRMLAFDRAAELYQLALTYKGGDNGEHPELHKKLANAFAAAGRGTQAAAEFVSAAKHTADEYESVNFQRLAADQYLRVGHIKEAFDILRSLAESVGIRLIERRWEAIVSYAFRRLMLKMRGLKFSERPPGEVSKRQLVQLDICWSLVNGFAMVEPIFGAAFHARHLMLALRCGEVKRIGLSLALEAGYAALGGERRLQYAQQISRMSTAIGLRIHSPQVVGLSAVNAAFCCQMAEQWGRAAEQARKAELILRDECTGVHWELTTARVILFTNLALQGELRELAQRFGEAIRDAVARGDVYAATSLPLMTNTFSIALAADRPEAARREIETALRQWETMTGEKFDMPHMFATLISANVALYTGKAKIAWQELDGQWHKIQKFLFLLRSNFFNTFLWFERGKFAAAAAADSQGVERRGFLGEVKRARAKVEKRRTPWAAGMANHLSAVLAYWDGDQGRCLDLLAESQTAFEESGVRMTAYSVAWIRGSLIGGEAGRKMTDSAELLMRQQGILRPDRIAQISVPGFPAKVE